MFFLSFLMWRITLGPAELIQSKSMKRLNQDIGIFFNHLTLVFIWRWSSSDYISLTRHGRSKIIPLRMHQRNVFPKFEFILMQRVVTGVPTHWEFSIRRSPLRLLKLNVKMAPEMAGFFNCLPLVQKMINRFLKSLINDWYHSTPIIGGK